MKHSIFEDLGTNFFLPVLMIIILLTFACEKAEITPPDRPTPQVIMEGDYQKTQNDCEPNKSSYLLSITRDRPTKEDIVDRTVDGVIVIKNLMNSPKSRIIAERVGSSYRIPSQKTVLNGRSAEISGMLQKSGKTLIINYRILRDQEPAMHCQSEFLDIR